MYSQNHIGLKILFFVQTGGYDDQSKEPALDHELNNLHAFFKSKKESLKFGTDKTRYCFFL